MTLPAPAASIHERHTVEVPGLGPIEFRPLSRGEALRMNDDGLSLYEAEVRIIGLATDTPAAEVRDWLEQVPAGAVQVLVAAITRTSGASLDADPDAARFP